MKVRSCWLVVGVALAALGWGCGKSAVTEKVEPVEREAENPWPKAVAALRKDTDFGTCQRVLNELTTAAAAPGATNLPVLPAEERASLQALLGLRDDEATEISGAGFTGLDAAHLAECFYLRDVASTLDAATQPPAVKATRALEWITRHVQLVAVGSVIPAAPQHILRRGSGGGLDRATVFLALCRQLDLDVYLIGGPNANNWPPAELPPDQRLTEPFWAAAVRDGNSLLLFDPIRGVPMPGPTAGKPATLAELVANPDWLKPWAADGKATLPNAEEIKVAKVYLTGPLSAVSARMSTFQKLAGTTLNVRAALDLAASKKAAEACGVTVLTWKPTRFPFTPTRSQRELLVAADGGTADAARVADLTFEQFPRLGERLAAVLGPVEPAFRERLLQVTLGSYGQAVLGAGLRERMQRGQYTDVSQLLVKRRDEFRALAARSGGNPTRNATVATWLSKTNELYQKRSVERLGSDAAKVQAIDAEIQKAWTEKPVESIVAGTIAEVIVQEVTFLLALTKHEQAERAERAAGRGATEKAAAKAAWTEANGWWDRYQPEAALHDPLFPGRAAQARILSARAATHK